MEELGFIKISSGKHGDISCVLIPNPHLVLKWHKENGTQNFDEHIYNCILELMADYGMRDFEDTFLNRITRFVEQVAAHTPPDQIDGSGADGLAAQKVLAAAVESVETGNVVRVR